MVGNVALVIRDKPLTWARLRASIVYRLGAVPRGEGMAETYLEPAVAGVEAALRRQLAAKADEIDMLSLHLDVARADASRRDSRLDAMEVRLAQVAESQDLLLRFFADMSASFAAGAERLRDRS